MKNQVDKIIIAIDGPGGSGKSTVAQILAQRLGFLYVNTGAMYRAMTLKVLRGNIPLNDMEKIGYLTTHTDVTIKRRTDGRTDVFLDGENVTNRVREVDVTSAVSPVSSIPTVRHWLVQKQRAAALTDNVVCEGRDISTVVFPDANYKYFLTASIEERARRRQGEFKKNGISVPLESVIKELATRDHLDSTREMSPLKKADDAIEIDSTGMTPDEVVGLIIGDINK